MKNKLRLDILILKRMLRADSPEQNLNLLLNQFSTLLSLLLMYSRSDASQSLLTTSTTSEESAQSFRNIILNVTVLAFLYKHIDPVNQAYIQDLNRKAA